MNKYQQISKNIKKNLKSGCDGRLSPALRLRELVSSAVSTATYNAHGHTE